MADSKGVKASLKKKVGPLPVWGWGVVIIGAYLAYRHFSGAAGGGSLTPPSTQTPPADSTLGAGGGGSAAPADYSTFTDALNQLGAQEAQNQSDLLTALAGLQFNTTPSGDGSGGNNGSPATSNAAGVHHTIPAHSPDFAQRAVAQTRAGTAAFGGVVSHRVLKNGATLITYASGRQVEQRPGHSAYVVHK